MRRATVCRGVDACASFTATYEQALPGKVRDGVRARPDQMDPLIDKDTAQNQRVGACPNQKSRATFSGHALDVGAGLGRESLVPMEARRAFAPARGAYVASSAAPYLFPEG